MIVAFQIHGFGQIVEGKLDIQDMPVPQIGWELDFDACGTMRVTGVEAYYVALGKHVVYVDLACSPERSSEMSAAEVVEFVRDNGGELTAFSGVELGDWCHCPLCG